MHTHVREWLTRLDTRMAGGAREVSHRLVGNMLDAAVF